MDAWNLFKTTQQNVFKNIGFPLLNFEIQFMNNDNIWSYNPVSKNFFAPQNIELKYTQDKIEAEFSILHETFHMIEDFILHSGFDPNNFNKESFQKNICKFFNLKNIVLTDKDVKNFKVFLDEYELTNPDLLKQLQFDDKFYVSGTQVAKYTEENFLKVKPNYIYTKNSTEIMANYFASKVLYDKMRLENHSPREMQILKNKIDAHIYKGSLIKKDETEFQQQLIMFKYFNKETLKNKIQNFVKKNNAYNAYNFDKSSKILTAKITEMKNIINDISKNFKTKKQLLNEQKSIEQIQQKIKNNLCNNISVINNFTPSPQDKHKFRDYSYQNIEQQFNELITFNKLSGINEIVADLQNNKNYIFYETRTKDFIIKSDKPNNEKCQQINNDRQHNDKSALTNKKRGRWSRNLKNKMILNISKDTHKQSRKRKIKEQR